MLNKIINFFLNNKLVTVLLCLLIVAWGYSASPFNDGSLFISNPVAVDAIPDIGENQQIVFTEWKGNSPQDIEDQISYPLTTALLGIPGVKTIRSSSIFGFSSIYIIFEEDIEFYWSRSRILEKLNSLPTNLLPENVSPTLGPDATALGQVFWYTLEGRDSLGNVTGGWDLDELRTIQDYLVKYSLSSASGVAEVASIGGYVKEYQIDVNPDILKSYNISLLKVVEAVKSSNKEIGAKTIEINKAEYFVRGIGYIKNIQDIENSVVIVNDNVPILVKDIAKVSLGPATRRGLLDKEGAEVVGGVVIARYGSNPLEVINNIKDKIKDVSSGLPEKILTDGTKSKIEIIPFYDRTKLIKETLGTLEEALSLEILITILVVLIMVMNLRASILITSLLPISVLMVFILMKTFHIDANIVALSGIAIAIGTMVDLGIILTENILKHIKESHTKDVKSIIFNASSEVSSAILTAVMTTIVSFIPVFTMQGAEGKLFAPLAYTKSFALISALLVSLLILPTLAHWFYGFKIKTKLKSNLLNIFISIIGIYLIFTYSVWGGLTLFALSISWILRNNIKHPNKIVEHSAILISIISTAYLLSKYWLPLGVEYSLFINFLFVLFIFIIILGIFGLVEMNYKKILKWCLYNKKIFFSIPIFILILGVTIWFGFYSTFGFISNGFDSLNINIKTTKLWSGLTHQFPGLGKEFMPSLDEGSFLYMPTSMPHSGFEQNKTIVSKLDMLVSNIPEVELVVGKMGRIESALDPAPISMYENIINYKPEYESDENGHRKRFKVDSDGNYILKSGDTLSNEDFLNLNLHSSELIADDDGQYFRNWRNHINSPNDIWNEITSVTKLPGITSSPKLQPIETRLVMLQTGMRAPMGIKVYGSSLESIEDFGYKLEKILKEIPSVKKDAVFADRVVGKPYIHLNINREKISRYGLTIQNVQNTLEVAIGGMKISSSVEGRERFPIRVRYPRELRDNPEELSRIFIPTPTGTQIPLSELIDIEYIQGPQMIKSENTFLVSYVLFDKEDEFAEVDVVEASKDYIQSKISSGELIVPSGVSYKFSGNYENQIRAEKRLTLILPIVLLVIFLILYFQFKSISTSLMVFSGVFVAFSGGFIMLWLYNQNWFLDFSMLGLDMRELFQIKTINLSVAIWVGFIALFGIATDDGVLIGTYLDQSFKENKPTTKSEIRDSVLEAGLRRVKPALMTTSTTLIALLPILTSTGRGADIMIPMAIPSFGGMVISILTIFIVPTLYSLREESKLSKEIL